MWTLNNRATDKMREPDNTEDMRKTPDNIHDMRKISYNKIIEQRRLIFEKRS
jgi:hypothetical protein